MKIYESTKICIVDDHLVFRQTIRHLLSVTFNFSDINEYSNGKDFLESLKLIKPDLVFMDINMPNMSGIEVTKKALKIYSDLKIIALTMLDRIDLIDKMKKAGAIAILSKDVDNKDILKAIETIIGKSSLNKKPEILTL